MRTQNDRPTLTDMARMRDEAVRLVNHLDSLRAIRLNRNCTLEHEDFHWRMVAELSKAIAEESR